MVKEMGMASKDREWFTPVSLTVARMMGRDDALHTSADKPHNDNMPERCCTAETRKAYRVGYATGRKALDRKLRRYFGA